MHIVTGVYCPSLMRKKIFYDCGLLLIIEAIKVFYLELFCLLAQRNHRTYILNCLMVRYHWDRFQKCQDRLVLRVHLECKSRHIAHTARHE